MPQPLRVLLRQFAGDERGVISVMAVGALILALAVAMIVIDTGAMLYARRDLQAATDAAALGAVRQLQSQEATQTAAETIFDINGFRLQAPKSHAASMTQIRRNRLPAVLSPRAAESTKRISMPCAFARQPLHQPIARVFSDSEVSPRSTRRQRQLM